jgi:hypothetical protein
MNDGWSFGVGTKESFVLLTLYFSTLNFINYLISSLGKILSFKHFISQD